MKEMKPYTIWEVRWIDSASQDDWHRPEFAAEAVECRTVGYIIARTKKTLQLTGSLSESGCVCSTMLIPRSAVLQMKRLR